MSGAHPPLILTAELDAGHLIQVHVHHPTSGARYPDEPLTEPSYRRQMAAAP